MDRHRPAAPSPGPYLRRAAGAAYLSLAVLLPPLPGEAGWYLGGAAILLLLAAWQVRRRRRPLDAASLQALLDLLPGAAFIRDTDGHYLAMNGAWAELQRTRRHAGTGGPALADVLDEAARELLRNGLPLSRPLEPRPAAEGAALRLELRLLAPGPDRPVAVAGFVDLAPARRSDGTEAAAAIRHLHGPLAGALGLVEVLAQTPLDPAQVQLLRSLGGSLDGLLRSPGPGLDLARLETGALEPDLAPCDLRQLADRVLEQYAAQAWDKGLRLYASVDWRLSGQHLCDGARLGQVLAQLLDNAIRHTARGTVEVHIALTGGSASHQKVRFTVTDSGPGLAPERLRALLQGEAAGSSGASSGRPGLGLRLCRQLATRMGGRLDLASAPESGLVASLELPLQIAAPLQAQPGMAGRLALLCTMDRQLGEGLGQALSALGFNVVEAGPGDLQALAGGGDPLYVVDAALVAAGHVPGGAHLVQIADPRIAADGRVELSGRPLLWGATLAACRAALGLARAPAAAPTPAARILVAEDHPVNRAVISQQLRRLGYPHALVENGEQALLALAREHFDLLLTDCRMPLLDGYALAGRIRAAEQGQARRLPIIALSGSSPPGQLGHCSAAGMDGFIAKPVRLAELEAQLATHLRRAAAANDSSVPSGSGTGGDDRLQQLCDALGPAGQVQLLLQNLLASGRADLVALDLALATGDGTRQRELLHRLSGALRLFGGSIPCGAPRHQRQALGARLDALQALLRHLQRRQARGGDG